MLKLIGGRLYQWDLGRRLEVHDLPDGTQITEVDFCHPGDAEALVVIPDRSGDTVTVDIPNILLQSDATIMIYECVGDVTVSKIPRSVVGRERPADYVYTETQVLTYKALEERIAKLEQGGVPEEQLAAAIAAYLEEHPIDAGLDEAELAAYLTENGYLTDTALTDAITQALAEAKASGQFDGAPGEDGADGADGQPGTDGVTPNLQIGTVETLEAGSDATASLTGTPENPLLNLGIPKGADGTSGKSAYQYAQDGGYTGTETEFAAKLAEELPDTLPNPNALTFTGSVTGIYDGSEAINVEIPSGGGDGEFRIIRTLEITEDVDTVIINTDDDGISFSLGEVYVMTNTMSYEDSASNFIFVFNGYWGTGDPYVNSSFKSTASSNNYYQTNMFHAISQNGFAFVEQPWRNYGTGYAVLNTNSKYEKIKEVKFSGKFKSGCNFTLIGRSN